MEPKKTQKKMEKKKENYKFFSCTKKEEAYTFQQKNLTTSEYGKSISRRTSS